VSHKLPSTDKAALLLIAMTIAGIAALGVFFFQRSEQVLDSMFKEKLQGFAAIGAMQFTAEEIAAIRTAEDLDANVYATVVNKLLRIKQGIHDAQYVYIMRRTDDAFTLEFVADAQAGLGIAELDGDGDGMLDSSEAPSQPGDPYDISETPALQSIAFEFPTTDEEITEDQWGAFLSGYAPIKDQNGNTVAVIGIDVSADDYLNEVQSIFTAFAIELLLAVCCVLVCSIVFIFGRRKIDVVRRIEEERTWLTQLAMHQVGNALSIFRFTTELLRDRLGERCKELAICEHLENLDEGIKQLSVMFEKLQMADRIRGDHIPYRAKSTSLSAFISDTVALFPHRKISVQSTGDDTVNLDAEVIGGVLRELLTNADRFSAPGAPITITAHVEKHDLEVSVKDYGVGIDKHEIPHVFERLYVGKHGWERNPHALGLGLFIAKGILEHIGGSIDIESEKNVGTTATFRVPLPRRKPVQS
jgi:signal transduction histidine kinase